MILDIIFIKKDGSDEISYDNVIGIYDGTLIFKDDKISCKDLVFNYKLLNSFSRNNIRLKVSTLKGTATNKEAKEISYFKNKIRNGEHRKDYRIIIGYDGASEYYCNKLSRLISVFERKLRQCVYITIISAYGNRWIEETFSKDLQNEVTEIERNKNRHQEMALECFTFGSYIDYLFTRRSIYNSENILDQAIMLCKSNDNTREEILKVLQKGKKVSLWEKLFKRFDMKFLEDDIDQIRQIRNDVMHNKEISDEEFVHYKNILRRCNRKMEAAIKEIENEKYRDRLNYKDILFAFNATMQGMLDLGEKIRELLTPAINDISSMIKSFTQETISNKLSRMVNLSIENNQGFNNTRNLNLYTSGFGEAAAKKEFIRAALPIGNQIDVKGLLPISNQIDIKGLLPISQKIEKYHKNTILFNHAYMRNYSNIVSGFNAPKSILTSKVENQNLEFQRLLKNIYNMRNIF